MLAGKGDMFLLSHDCATWDAMHQIQSAVSESMTSTNLALVLIWIHVLFSRKNNKNNKKNEGGPGSGETANNKEDDDDSAARPRATEEETSGSPKDRRRVIRDSRRKKKKFVPTLECIQEGFDEDGSDSY